MVRLAINYIDDNGVRQIFSDIKRNLDSINGTIDSINDTVVLTYDIATSAQNTANSAYTTANKAYDKANSAHTTANSAYTKANSASNTASSASSEATSAHITANSAYTTANKAYNTANNAYNLASKGSITSGTQTFTIVGRKSFNLTNSGFYINSNYPSPKKIANFAIDSSRITLGAGNNISSTYYRYKCNVDITESSFKANVYGRGGAGSVENYAYIELSSYQLLLGLSSGPSIKLNNSGILINDGKTLGWINIKNCT